MYTVNKLYTNKTESSLKRSCALLILGALILIRSLGIVTLDQYALMALCLFFLVLMPYKDCKYLLFFLLPLSCILQAFTISFGTLLLYIKSPHKKFSFWGPFAILLFVEGIHVIYSDVTLINFLYYATFLFTFFYLLSDGDRISSPSYCTKMFTYGLMISLLAVIYGMLQTFGFVGAFSGMYRDGSVIGASSEEGAVGVSLNANNVAYYSLALFSIMLYQPSKLRYSKVVLYAGVTIAVIAGIISFSRSWIILLTFFVLALLLLSSHKKSLFAAIIAALIIVPTFSLFSDVVSGYSNRFTSDDMETAGNRKGLTMKLFDYMNDNPDAYIWGSGVLTFYENTKRTVSPHNATQQILVCTGFIGIFAFFAPIIMFCKRYYSKKRGFLPFLPFLVCFLDVQTIQFLSPHFLMLILMASMYCIKPEFEEHE